MAASNKDLLKLENEYRDELPKYKEKPRITSPTKNERLTQKLNAFLEKTKQGEPTSGSSKSSTTSESSREGAHVEMDIFITPT